MTQSSAAPPPPLQGTGTQLRFDVLARSGGPVPDRDGASDPVPGTLDLGPDLASSVDLLALSSVILGDLASVCRHTVRFVHRREHGDPEDRDEKHRVIAAVLDVALSDRWPLGAMFPALGPNLDACTAEGVTDPWDGRLTFAPGELTDEELDAGMWWNVHRTDFPHGQPEGGDVPFVRFTFISGRPFPYGPDSKREARAWVRRAAGGWLCHIDLQTWGERDHLESEPRLLLLHPEHVPERLDARQQRMNAHLLGDPARAIRTLHDLGLGHLEMEVPEEATAVEATAVEAAAQGHPSPPDLPVTLENIEAGLIDFKVLAAHTRAKLRGDGRTRVRAPRNHLTT